MDELEEIRSIAASALKKADDALAKINAVESRENALEARMDSLEKRMDILDGKMDTLLDSTSQIKMMLMDNTAVTKSAKRNAKGWGFMSVAISFFFRLVEIFI